MAPIIIIMGPPGAGKGTQSDRLAKNLGGVHLSSGQIMRNCGDQAIIDWISAGNLAKSEDVERLVGEAIAKVPTNQPIVLDGFTRMLDEAEWLAARAAALQRPIAAVIYLEVEPKEAVARNLKRGRVDDTIEAQHQRWSLYRQATQPVLDYYQEQGLLKTVNGVGTVDAVADRVRRALNG